MPGKSNLPLGCIRNWLLAQKLQPARPQVGEIVRGAGQLFFQLHAAAKHPANAMAVGTGRYRQVKHTGVSKGTFIHPPSLCAQMGGIHGLYAVNVPGEQLDMVDVIPLPEGMRLDDDGAALVHLGKRPAGGAQVNVLVVQQPVLVQVIDKKFCPVIGIFKTKEDLQPDFVPLLFGVFISQTEARYPLLPGQLPGERWCCR